LKIIAHDAPSVLRICLDYCNFSARLSLTGKSKLKYKQNKTEQLIRILEATKAKPLQSWSLDIG